MSDRNAILEALTAKMEEIWNDDLSFEDQAAAVLELPEIRALVDALTSIKAALDIPNQSDSKRGRYHYDWARIDDEFEKATAALAAIKEPKT